MTPLLPRLRRQKAKHNLDVTGLRTYLRGFVLAQYLGDPWTFRQ